MKYAEWHRERGPVTREDVLWAYRFLLDREPESEDAYGAHMLHPTPRSLREALIASDEFQARLNWTARDRWVIAPIAGGSLLAWINLTDRFVSGGMMADAFEPELTDFIIRNLKPGDVFYDVGANLGWHTLHAAVAVGREGHVHAFEPRADLAGYLRRTLELNDLEGRVTVHQLALGAGPGHTQLLVVPGENNPGHSFIGPARPGEVAVGEAEVVALDALGLPPPALIKIDTEGAEGLILLGARAMLEQHKPLIVCEIFPEWLRRVSGLTVAGFRRQAGRLGYEMLEEFGAIPPDNPKDVVLRPSPTR